MKQTTKALLCTALLWAGACSTDTVTDAPAADDTARPTTFTAVGDETRTLLTPDNAVHWTAGDQIIIIPGTATAIGIGSGRQIFTTDDNGATATFTGQIAESQHYHAIYPAEAYNGIITSRPHLPMIKVPDTQVATAGSFDKAANVSYARSENTTLYFRNLCGLIKFRRPSTSTHAVAAVRMRGNNHENLSGSANLDLSVPNSVLTVGNNNLVTLEGTIETGKDYYIAVIPQVLENGFTLSFMATDDGHFYSVTSTKRTEIKAGHILNLGELDPEMVNDDFEYDEATKTFTAFTQRGFELWMEAAQRDPATSCKLETDVDLTGTSWTPIIPGSFQHGAADPGTSNYRGYTGTFDGNGHVVKGLNLTKSTGAYSDETPFAGFFGILRGTVRNVTFESPSLTDGSAAVVAGYAVGSTIENCHVTNARISSKPVAKERSNTQAAGIAARAADGTTITDCTVTGSISATEGIAGGIVGEISTDVTIAGCHFTGDLTTSRGSSSARDGYIGGIVATCTSGAYSILGCTADVTATSAVSFGYIGGIIGRAGGTCTLAGCATAGTLANTDTSKATSCGGLIGYLRVLGAGSYSSCTVSSKISGALFGDYYYDPTAEACFTTNMQIDAVAGNESFNATMRTDNIVAKADEMNAAIAQYGWQFVENIDDDKAVFPLKPVRIGR